MNFFAELKRRNVYKVAVAYIVAGWALSQGIAQVFPVFDIPNWLIRLSWLGALRSRRRELNGRKMSILWRRPNNQKSAPGFLWSSSALLCRSDYFF